jgi:hypothetical protein
MVDFNDWQLPGYQALTHHCLKGKARAMRLSQKGEPACKASACKQ